MVFILFYYNANFSSSALKIVELLPILICGWGLLWRSKKLSYSQTYYVAELTLILTILWGLPCIFKKLNYSQSD